MNMLALVQAVSHKSVEAEGHRREVQPYSTLQQIHVPETREQFYSPLCRITVMGRNGMVLAGGVECMK